MTSSSLTEQELSEAYDVEHLSSPEQKDFAQRVIRPPRGPSPSLPDLRMPVALKLADRMLDKFGLAEYEGIVTSEMKKRPIPQVFKTVETAALTSLVKVWLPHIYARLIPEIVPPMQAINRVSRLGDPRFDIPKNKLDVLGGIFAELLAGNMETRTRVIETYVRLQTEAAKKARDYLFINGAGRVYAEHVGREQRIVDVRDVGPRVSSRVRAIFNMPVENIFKQVLDSALHNAMLEYPAFHHDMFGRKVLPVEPGTFHLCIDVKHFERHTADAVYNSGLILGGEYGKITELFRNAKFIVPSDDRTATFLLKPRYDKGYSVQFASGDSRVAGSQKEIFTALLGEFIRITRRVSYGEAINFVFSGGDRDFTIRNYGDDNSYSGNEKLIRAVFAFLGEYLTVEEETPPKFLGFVWADKWQLPLSSYVLKTHFNERPPYSNFRKYPNLGWVLKRDTYSEYGAREIAEHVYPYEDVLLAQAGNSWTDICFRADAERKQSAATPGQSNRDWIMGKDYAMTAQEKVMTGEYFGLTPQSTAPIIKHLLGEEWRRKLRW